MATVGSAGAVLLFFRIGAALVAFGLAAILAFTVVAAENGLPVILYAVCAILVLAAYAAGERGAGRDGDPGRGTLAR